MKYLRGIEIDHASHEEILPDFAADFPYIATCAELDRYIEPSTPWHWHRAVELFYMESGVLEYSTPGGTWRFPAGSGGMVNSNVLHATRTERGAERNVQLLHLFEPSLLAGEQGSRIERRYILPLLTAPGAELIPLSPEEPAQAEILRDIRAAFAFSGQTWGDEVRLREALTRIWMKLSALVEPNTQRSREGDGAIKQLLVYVHTHFQEELCVEQLAQAAHISKRACFRLFRDKLHMTPLEYIRSYRLQKACQMLAHSEVPVTQVAGLCGLGSSSYFGKVFRETFGCTPREYRRRWRDCEKSGR